jgi:hypothetical protein
VHYTFPRSVRKSYQAFNELNVEKSVTIPVYPLIAAFAASSSRTFTPPTAKPQIRSQFHQMLILKPYERE